MAWTYLLMIFTHEVVVVLDINLRIDIDWLKWAESILIAQVQQGRIIVQLTLLRRGLCLPRCQEIHSTTSITATTCPSSYGKLSGLRAPRAFPDLSGNALLATAVTWVHFADISILDHFVIVLELALVDLTGSLILEHRLVPVIMRLLNEVIYLRTLEQFAAFLLHRPIEHSVISLHVGGLCH